MNTIQQFYNQNPFPGIYTIDQLTNYEISYNPYLNIINQHVGDNQSVLDVGCGTGLLTNKLALQHPTSNFTGIDFSIGADFAHKFAVDNNINNAKFIKKDFLEYSTKLKFDTIIAQSFLTHVPEYQTAINNIKQSLAPGGTLILGVYNPCGKIAKKFIKINYRNARLKLDQESNPCEITFSHTKMLQTFSEYTTVSIHPSFYNHFVGFYNLFNVRNGGLTVYIFKDHCV